MIGWIQESGKTRKPWPEDLDVNQFFLLIFIFSLPPPLSFFISSLLFLITPIITSFSFLFLLHLATSASGWLTVFCVYFGLQGDVGLPGPSGTPGDGSLRSTQTLTIYKGDKVTQQGKARSRRHHSAFTSHSHTDTLTDWWGYRGHGLFVVWHFGGRGAVIAAYFTAAKGRRCWYGESEESKEGGAREHWWRDRGMVDQTEHLLQMTSPTWWSLYAILCTSRRVEYVEYVWTFFPTEGANYIKIWLRPQFGSCSIF